MIKYELGQVVQDGLLGFHELVVDEQTTEIVDQRDVGQLFAIFSHALEEEYDHELRT